MTPITIPATILGRADHPLETDLTRWYKNNEGFCPPVFEKKDWNTDYGKQFNNQFTELRKIKK